MEEATDCDENISAVSYDFISFKIEKKFVSVKQIFI